MRKILIPVLFFLFIAACTPREESATREVSIRLPLNPESLNPVNYKSVYAMQIINLLFQSLLSVDLENDQIVPLLVKQKPAIRENDSLSYFTYEIREEASWDNNQPITGHDVHFSLKVLNCPLVENDQSRLLFDFIEDIKISRENPKIFTLVCRGAATELELLTGDFFILPHHIFDPSGILKTFSLKEIKTNRDDLINNTKIKEYASFFNNPNHLKDKLFLVGSGPYMVAEWETGQYIKLKKKTNWWGDKLTAPVSFITANPELIHFKVITEDHVALIALKNEQIDVYGDIPSSDFVSLQNNTTFSQKYNFFKPSSYKFIFIGINSRLPKLSDKTTRQAIAYLLNLEQIISITQQGFAEQTVSIISPAQKNYYNSSIKPYTYDLKKAEQLLREGGWDKVQGKWMRYNENEAISLTLRLQYKAGNLEYENIAIIFQDAASKMGIPVVLEPVDGALRIQNLKNHEFELSLGSMVGNPFAFNFKPLLHTGSAHLNRGRNYTGFGNEESDKIIELLIKTDTEEEKIKYLKRLQALLHEDCSLIFLYYIKNRIVIHKKFTNTKASGIKPGYDVAAFTLNESN